VILFFFGPVIWIMLTAFKEPRDVYSLSVIFTPTLDNIRAAFGSPYFLGQRTLNSLIVTFGTLLLSIPIATAAAYAFSRFRFPAGAPGPLECSRPSSSRLSSSSFRSLSRFGR
jgi:multiple sugar transport system permease protein